MEATAERRLIIVEQWAKDHQERCEERLSDIKGTITEMRADIKAASKFQNRTLLGILLALLAFGGKELWASRGGIAGAASVASVAHYDR